MSNDAVWMLDVILASFAGGHLGFWLGRLWECETRRSDSSAEPRP